MRVWPGLRLVGAGGKVQKGVFVTVSEVGERVTLESGQSFEPRELLKHTRLCSAITYASVQGLTLRGRVWLCDVDSPHFTMKHLYMGCSPAPHTRHLQGLFAPSTQNSSLRRLSKVDSVAHRQYYCGG